jgi:cytochrome d ubiquinol oxidase subunit II
MYIALIGVLFGLIARSVAIEFRNRSESASWRKFWDWALIIGSSLTMLLLGVAMGNILHGVPLDAQGYFTGNFFTLLNPYSLLIGVTGFAMLAMHGALFLVVRGEGDLAERARKWGRAASILFVSTLVISYIATIATDPFVSLPRGRTMLFDPEPFLPLYAFSAHPGLKVIPVLALVAAVIPGFLNQKGKKFRALRHSFIAIAFVFLLDATVIFPNMVPASNNLNLSLTIANSSSSQLTLLAMLIIAVIGMPIVVWYTVWIHRLFGKMEEKRPQDEVGTGRATSR